MQSSILALENVSVGYGGRAMLSGIDLNLEPGGFYFLTGPSGAGKTTFMRMCFLELAPLAGNFTLFGKKSTAYTRDEVANARRRVGLVHQDCQFLDHLNCRDNIALPLTVAGRDTSHETDNIDQLLEWVGLEHRAEAFPPELSGGERQRAALARAVIMSPDVILADEPTGNVDWEMSERLLGLLIELNKLGKTILIATHDLPLIRSAKSRVNTRVLRLSESRMLMAGAEL